MGTSALADLTDDELREEVTTWAARVAAGEAKLLELIGELDDRGAWGGYGLLSCAHWLSWHCAMGLGTARERVRVARALRELPRIAERFRAGALTWTQVRAITRVVTPEDEQMWLELAEACNGAQIERLVQGVRRSMAGEEDRADPDRAAERRRPTVRYRPDGRVSVSFVLEPEEATVVLAAMERVLDEARADVQAVPVPEPDEPVLVEQPEPPMPRLDGLSLEEARAAKQAWTEACWAVSDRNAAARHQQAARQLARATAVARGGLALRPTLTDALVRMSVATLDAPGTLPVAAKERLRVCIDPLSGWARTRDGSLLPPGRLPVPSVGLAPVDLTAWDKGRTMREVSLPLRRVLGQVDGERCRMPGCTRVNKLHAHHVVYWSLGGPTDLGNLVLVCSRHHTLIHQLGFRLRLRPDRSLEVRTTDGVPVLHHPRLRTAPAGDLASAFPDVRLTVHAGDRLDLDHAVYVIRQQAA